MRSFALLIVMSSLCVTRVVAQTPVRYSISFANRAHHEAEITISFTNLDDRPLHSYTFVNCAVVATGAIFQPLVGALLDLGWDGTLIEGARVYSAGTFQEALSSLAAFLAVGLAAGLALREPGRGWTNR